MNSVEFESSFIFKSMLAWLVHTTIWRRLWYWERKGEGGWPTTRWIGSVIGATGVLWENLKDQVGGQIILEKNLSTVYCHWRLTLSWWHIFPSLPFPFSSPLFCPPPPPPPFLSFPPFPSPLCSALSTPTLKNIKNKNTGALFKESAFHFRVFKLFYKNINEAIALYFKPSLRLWEMWWAFCLKLLRKSTLLRFFEVAQKFDCLVFWWA